MLVSATKTQKEKPKQLLRRARASIDQACLKEHKTALFEKISLP